MLVPFVCGPLLLAFGCVCRGPSEQRNARGLEAEAWSQMLAALAPAVLALGVLVGWALQEPQPSDEAVHPAVLIVVLPIAICWARAGARAIRSLLSRPNVPAATIGFLLARVVIRADLAAALDSDALQAVRAHERAHARHRDPLRVWVAQLVTDLQWPLPAARKRFDVWLHALELARDEEAREAGVEGVDLAAGILAAAALRSSRWSFGVVAAIAAREARFDSRIRRLLEPLPPAPGAPAETRGRFWTAAGLAGAVALGFLYGEQAIRILPGVLE